MISTPGAPKTVVMLEAVSADETFSLPVDVRGYTHIAVFVIPNGTVSSGVVQVQEATVFPDAPSGMQQGSFRLFGGTWSQVGSDISPSTGAISVAHLTVAAYSHLRLRVSTVIGGGGTVSAVLVAA